MLQSCLLLRFKASCVPGFLFDCAPLLLIWFLCIPSNPVAFRFPPLFLVIQHLSSFVSSADLSSGLKISGMKRFVLFSVPAETGTRRQKGVNWTGKPQQGSARGCTPHPSLSASFMVHSDCPIPQKMTTICILHSWQTSSLSAYTVN